MTSKGFIVALAVAAATVLAWLWLRSSPSAGHSSPDDAMAWGWAVYPRGLTGWREIGPNGEIVDHDEGGESVPR